MRGCWASVIDYLSGGDKVGFGFVVAAGIQVPRKGRKIARRDLDSQTMALRDGDVGVPEVDAVVIGLSRLDELRLHY